MSNEHGNEGVKERSPANAASAITLRPLLPEDEQFLEEVYQSTRAEELAQIPWSEAQLKMFLKMQLKARDQSYRMHYPGLDDRIILFQDKKVGRLIVVRRDEDIRLADIALLPQFRNSGIGTSLVKDLMMEAKESGKPLRLQVEILNEQARRLYERLGFATTGETVTHFPMEYSQSASEKSVSD
jgi:ribosomal protein S18 acetylase RimI-like enzyme